MDWNALIEPETRWLNKGKFLFPLTIAVNGALKGDFSFEIIDSDRYQPVAVVNEPKGSTRARRSPVVFPREATMLIFFASFDFSAAIPASQFPFP